jgi:hypothetical protein
VPAKEPYVYRIDGQDRIVSVSGNWLAFAEENHAGNTCHPDRVLGRFIWDFVAGEPTRHLYEMVLQKVRATLKPIRIKFRCDAPDERRFCHLVIIPLAAGVLDCYSRVSTTELRPTVRLLDVHTPRASALIRMCSVCKRVALSDDQWLEVEDAITALKLFDVPRLPHITHAVCPDCLREVAVELDKEWAA